MRAIYLYNTNKNTPMDFFLPIVREYASKLGWTNTQVFSDGWDEPEDWNMMVEYTTHKTNRLTDVLFLNLERWHGKPELARQEIGVLHDSGVILHVIHGFLHEIREQHTLLRLYDQISAWDYFTDVMSFKTREGMRHKKGGRLPFGLKRDENGNAVADENYPIVQRVMDMWGRELSVPDISRTMNIPQQKVRSIIRAWKDRV